MGEEAREISPDSVLERRKLVVLKKAQGEYKWLRVCGSREGEAWALLHM